MSALPAVATPAATDPAHTEREILTRIARGGLLISEEELYYQLHRHGIDLRLLPDLLGDLQQRGLIESQTHLPAHANRRRAGARQRPPGARGDQSHPLAFRTTGAGEKPRPPPRGRRSREPFEPRPAVTSGASARLRVPMT